MGETDREKCFVYHLVATAGVVIFALVMLGITGKTERFSWASYSVGAVIGLAAGMLIDESKGINTSTKMAMMVCFMGAAVIIAMITDEMVFYPASFLPGLVLGLLSSLAFDIVTCQPIVSGGT